jgi:hypothetical protein
MQFGQIVANASELQVAAAAPVGYDPQPHPRKDARRTRSARMKKPSDTVAERIPKQGAEPFDRAAWEREHGPLFSDEVMDSFLEAIWESKGRKLPDYLRTRNLRSLK